MTTDEAMHDSLLKEVEPSKKEKDHDQLLYKYKVSIRNLDGWFGTKQILKNINLDIKPNVATAIIGPSGCGKTTLIRCLNRMHEMTPGATAKGSVVIDDIDIYDKSSRALSSRRQAQAN